MHFILPVIFIIFIIFSDSHLIEAKNKKGKAITLQEQAQIMSKKRKKQDKKSIEKNKKPVVNIKKKDSPENTKKNDIITEVKNIIKDEMKKTSTIRYKKYLSPWSIELGGFVSYQVKGFDSKEEYNNTIIKAFPIINVFFSKNVAVSLRGETTINLTTKDKLYNGGLGLQFAFGINKAETFIFYSSVFAGLSMNTALSNLDDNSEEESQVDNTSWSSDTGSGYRYGNEIGVKYILTPGVILNVTTMILFDNTGTSIDGFQNLLVPVIGITVWF